MADPITEDLFRNAISATIQADRWVSLSAERLAIYFA
jgi:hypothetical protein